MIVFLQDFNYLLDTQNESVYNIGIVNKRENYESTDKITKRL